MDAYKILAIKMLAVYYAAGSCGKSSVVNRYSNARSFQDFYIMFSLFSKEWRFLLLTSRWKDFPGLGNSVDVCVYHARTLCSV